MNYIAPILVTLVNVALAIGVYRLLNAHRRNFKQKDNEAEWHKTVVALDNLWDIFDDVLTGRISANGASSKDRFANFLFSVYGVSVKEGEQLFNEMMDRFNPHNVYIKGNVVELPESLKDLVTY